MMEKNRSGEKQQKQEEVEKECQQDLSSFLCDEGTQKKERKKIIWSKL